MSIIKQIVVDMEEARQKEVAKDDPFAQAELTARELGLPPVEAEPVKESSTDGVNKAEFERWKKELASVDRHLQSLDPKHEREDYQKAYSYKQDVLSKLSKLKPVTENVMDPTSDLVRIVQYWRTNGGFGMSDVDLASVVSNEFEQLEYPPDQVAKLTVRAVKAIKKR